MPNIPNMASGRPLDPTPNRYVNSHSDTDAFFAAKVDFRVMEDLKQKALRGDAHAAEILMNYTYHTDKETRDLAKSWVVEIHEKEPKIIGELAANLMLFDSRARDHKKDIELPAPPVMVAFIAAKHEKSIQNTGLAKTRAMEAIRESSLETLEDPDNLENILQSGRLVTIPELDAYRTPDDNHDAVRYCGAFNLATQDKHQNGIDGLTEQIHKNAEGDKKTLVASVLDSSGSAGHYATLLVRGKTACILDTAPPKNPSTGETDRTMSNQQFIAFEQKLKNLSDREGNALFENVEFIQEDLQHVPEKTAAEIESALYVAQPPDDISAPLPHTCGLFSLWLTDYTNSQGDVDTARESVGQFIEHFEQLGAEEKWALNESTRVKVLDRFLRDSEIQRR